MVRPLPISVRSAQRKSRELELGPYCQASIQGQYAGAWMGSKLLSLDGGLRRRLFEQQQARLGFELNYVRTKGGREVLSESAGKGVIQEAEAQGPEGGLGKGASRRWCRGSWEPRRGCLGEVAGVGND